MLKLTHPQKRILVNQQIYEDSKFAYMYGLVSVLNKTNSQIQDAINACIDFFDCLRIRFAKNNKEVCQYMVDFEKELIEVRDANDDFHAIRMELYNQKLYRFYIVENDSQSLGYYFILHHAIVDAYTITLITKFIHNYLEGNATGSSQRSFLDFIKIETQYLLGNEIHRDEAYFSQNIHHSKSYKYFPEFDLRCQRTQICFTDEESKRTLAFCKSKGISIFKLIFTSIFLLLYGEDNVDIQTVSTTHHNRNTLELLETGGMMTSTIPVVQPIDTSLTFNDFLAQSLDNISASLEKHQYPLDLLMNQINGKDCFDLNLTDVMFNSIPFGDTQIHVERFSPGEDIARFNFKLNPDSKPKGANIELALDYGLSHSNQVHALQLLERAKNITFLFLEKGNEVIANHLKQPKNILDEMDKVFIKRFSQLAVVDQDSSLTYEQLYNSTHSIAETLRDSSQVVGIINKRCCWFVAAVLGILKAGKIFLVLDLEQPEERLKEIIEQTKISHILVFDGSLHPFHAKKTIDVTRLPGVVTREKNHVCELAYILFTSGTTGTPKGAMISCKALLSLCEGLKFFYEISGRKQMTSYCHFNFDVSVGEIFLAMYTGSILHILSDERRMNLSLLDEYFNRNSIDYAFMPTKMGEKYIKYFPKSALKNLTIVGEKMTFYQNATYAVFNAYGPTECTVFSHIAKVDHGAKRYSFGQALPGVLEQVIDGSGNTSFQGELILAGEQVAFGYLNDYSLTKDKFVKITDDTTHLSYRGFRTGDLVEKTVEGLYFISRMDRQIKYNGYRINLDEIEAVANGSGLVTASACVLSDNRITLFVVPTEHFSETDLISQLKSRLPSYYLPHSISVHEALPENRSGKTDYKVMGETKNSRNLETTKSEATPVEEELLRILMPYVKVDDFDMHTNLMKSGIDSLEIIEVILEIEHALTVTLKFSDFLAHNTINKLSHYIDMRALSTCVVKAKEGEGRPIVLLFDLSGDVMSYKDFMDSCKNRPIFLVTFYPFEVDTIEEYCEILVERLLEVGSYPEYDLMGYSSGGIFAIEMARQLGEKCKHAFMVDTLNFKSYPKRLYNYLAYMLANVSSVIRFYGYKSSLNYILRQVKLLWRNKRLLAEQVQIKSMIQSYNISHLPTQVSLFVSSKMASRTDDKLGWGEMLPKEAILNLEGNHMNVLRRDNAGKICKIIEFGR